MAKLVILLTLSCFCGLAFSKYVSKRDYAIASENSSPNLYMNKNEDENPRFLKENDHKDYAADDTNVDTGSMNDYKMTAASNHRRFKRSFIRGGKCAAGLVWKPPPFYCITCEEYEELTETKC